MSKYLIYYTGGAVPDCFLCLLRPDWSAAVTVDYSFQTEMAEGRTGIEDRSPEQESLHHTVGMTLTLDDAEGDELHKALLSAAYLPIGLPLIVDEGYDTWLHAPQKVLSWSDAGAVEISAAAVSYAHPYAAPLLVGRLSERPAIRPLGGGMSQLSLKFVEDAPWDCRVGPGEEWDDWTEFSATPDWADKISSLSRDQVEVTNYPQARQSGILGSDGSAREGQEASFTMEREQIGALLRFFLARKGSVEAFTAPVWYQPGEATPQTPDSGKFRLENDVLTIKYSAPWIGSTTLRMWREVDLVGAVVQSSPAVTHLYTLTWADGRTPTRYTAWESPQTYLGQPYTPARVSHSGLKETLAPIGDKVSLSVFVGEPGNPLLELSAGEIESRLYLEIVECEPGNPVGNPEIVFSGEVRTTSDEGANIIGHCATYGGLFDRRLPAFYLQRGCNYTLFGTCCKLQRANWAKPGVLAADVSSAAVGFTPAAAPVGAYADKWFSGGWISSVGTDGRTYRRAILDCSQAGAAWSLKLNRALPAVCAGQPATAYPGCSLDFSVCREKFANGDNFGGFPDLADELTTSEGNPQSAAK